MSVDMKPSPAAKQPPSQAPKQTAQPPQPQKAEDRRPLIGEWVHYWGGTLGNLRRRPAQVMDYSPKGDKRVHLNIHNFGGVISPERDVDFSAEPLIGRWAWME